MPDKVEVLTSDKAWLRNFIVYSTISSGID